MDGYDGWKISFLLGWPIFHGELLVSGRVLFFVIRGFSSEGFWLPIVYIHLNCAQKPRDVEKKTFFLRQKMLTSQTSRHLLTQEIGGVHFQPYFMHCRHVV